MTTLVPASSDTTGLRPSSAAPSTRLHGNAAWLARGGYLAVVAVILILFVMGLPSQYRFSSAGYIGVSIQFGPSGEPRLDPQPGLAASEAGVRPGDILLAVDGQPILPGLVATDLHRRLMGPIGTPVTLEVRQADGSVRTLRVVRDGRLMEQAGLTLESYARYLVTLDLLLMAGFLLPALVIFARRSDDWLALFVSFTLVNTAIAYTGEMYAPSLEDPSWRFFTLFLSVAHNTSILLFMFVFPNGRFVPKWTREMLALGAVWVLLKQLPPPLNPLYLPFFVGNAIDLLIFGTGIYAQVYRYRHVSTPVEQQQTKWIVFGISMAFIGVYAYYLPQFMLPALQEPGPSLFYFRLIGQTLSSVMLLVFPLSVLFSILRYRLYQIDVIINRTLVYLPLTAVLAGLLAVSSEVSKRLLLGVMGGESDVSGLLATLVIVVAFEPIKSAIQKPVDRFFKETPDPARELDKFCAQVRARVFPADLGELARSLLDHAVRGLGAASGAVYLGGQLAHRARGWNGQTDLVIPLAGQPGEMPLGTLALAARKNGGEYTAYDRQLLEQAAGVLAAAVKQDAILPVASQITTSEAEGNSFPSRERRGETRKEVNHKTVGSKSV